MIDISIFGMKISKSMIVISISLLEISKSSKRHFNFSARYFKISDRHFYFSAGDFKISDRHFYFFARDFKFSDRLFYFSSGDLSILYSEIDRVSNIMTLIYIIFSGGSNKTIRRLNRWKRCINPLPIKCNRSGSHRDRSRTY